MNSTGIAYICIAAVIVTALVQCGSARVDPKETVAVAEACAKVGKEPSINIRAGSGIQMGCASQPAASAAR